GCLGSSSVRRPACLLPHPEIPVRNFDLPLTKRYFVLDYRPFGKAWFSERPGVSRPPESAIVSFGRVSRGG
ncbi:MAG: hypothetical protein LBK53_06670, partial [Heliobacteriaceae bacterium]|nr:hypothetical protein [Heliobacteriaceae bacterium]